MIQRGERPRLTLEPREAVRVLGEGRWQNLDCDVTAKVGVRRAIHLAHTTDAELRGDLIRAEPGASSKSHDATAALAVSTPRTSSSPRQSACAPARRPESRLQG